MEYSQRQERILVEMWNKGFKSADIGERLGRSSKAVRSKASRMRKDVELIDSPRGGKKWTDEELENLSQLYKELYGKVKKPIAQIAERLEGRKHREVVMKIYYLRKKGVL